MRSAARRRGHLQACAAGDGYLPLAYLTHSATNRLVSPLVWLFRLLANTK
jgi:hypothetical protein